MLENNSLKMKKNIFVSIHVEESPVAFPLAAAVLKTAVEASPVTADWTNEHREYFLPLAPAKAAAELAAAGADAFGFSAYTWNAGIIIETVRHLRKLAPGAFIYAGGPQVTAVPEEFRKTGLFDALIEGEGENAVPEALSQLTDGGTSAPFDFSSSESPYPGIIGKRRYEGILWEISRGCPYNCAFCYESRGSSEIKTIPDERIIEELRLFQKKRIARIWVLDPTFNHSSSHAESVLEKIIRYNPYSHYTFEVRAELMTERLCELFSEIDASLQIGLQSSDPAVLRGVNRSLNPDKFLKKCRMMSDYGLSFGIDLIYGLPFDTPEKFRKSLDFAVEAGPNNIDIFPLAVLPGTELSDKADSCGLSHQGFPSYLVTESTNYKEAELAAAARLTDACDNLYNREQAFPWFMTVAGSLGLRPSELFLKYAGKGDPEKDPVHFLRAEFRAAGKSELFEIIESFILWSRTAEAAFASPGQTFTAKLCRKPEILDELASMSAAAFMKRYPSGKSKTYRITFDGSELYIN